MTDPFDNWTCGGGVLASAAFPGMFGQFGRAVVPLLQKRSVFRTEYAGQTLRENLRA